MAFNFNIMKKTLFITFLFMSIGLYSQGNLQFNRVVNIEIKKKLTVTINNTTGGPGGKNVLETVVIPEKKVWKIVNVSVRYYDENRQDEPPSGIVHDGITVTMNGIIIWHPPQVQRYSDLTFPVWINEGSKDLIGWNYHQSTTPLMLSISAIEFNIVN